MAKFTLKMKLGLLGSFFIAIISLLGFIGIQSSNQLADSLSNVGTVQLPAVRTMTLIDMMHDGLRAVVFKAIYYGDSTQTETKTEIASELSEMKQNLDNYLQAIEKLPLNETTKAAVNDSKEEVTKYSLRASEIVDLALSGKRNLVPEKLPQFETAFVSLENKLEVLGDLIEKDSNASVDASTLSAKEAKTLSYFVFALSLIIGIGATVVFSTSLTRHLSQVAANLSTNAIQVASAAKQISTSSQELSRSSTEQALSLENTATALEQITSQISKSTENAQTTSETSHESQRKAEEGQKAVDQMITAMGEISLSNEAILAQIHESNAQMAEIVKVIQNIGSKTKVINDIVFQTNLLSFNASVEAARAGEHGKGFAVVAQEVGNLARMSGSAAKEITSMLDASILKVEGIARDTQNRVVSLVQSGKEKITSGVAVANQCSDVLNDIVLDVAKVSRLSQEITQASKEQSVGTIEINKAMSQLDSATQQNAATSREAASASQILSSQAHSMKDAVEDLMAVINGKKDAA